MDRKAQLQIASEISLMDIHEVDSHSLIVSPGMTKTVLTSVLLN
jgi:hypothetical protein